MCYLVETGKRCLAARKKMARGTTDAELSGFIAKSLCKSLLFRWILKAGVKCTHEPGRTSTVQAERHTMLDNVIHTKYKLIRENTTLVLVLYFWYWCLPRSIVAEFQYWLGRLRCSRPWPLDARDISSGAGGRREYVAVLGRRASDSFE